MIHIFIINSFAGNRERSLDLREHLKKYADLNYFVFNTLSAGQEEDIARKMCRYFKGERIRFYCCGGAGTMRNMLNGIDSFSNAEVAMLPCGFSNAFIYSFDDTELFYDIDNLINGTAIPVDYIRTNYGLALNAVSFGIDSQTVDIVAENKDLEGFGRNIPYIVGLIGSTLGTKSRKMSVSVDGNTISEDISELIIGNGGVISRQLFISDITNIHDGEAEYGIAVNKDALGIFKLLIAMHNRRKDRIGKMAITGSGSVFEIRSGDEKEINMNLDGEIIKGGDYWRIEVVRDGLNFVIPVDYEEETKNRKDTTEGLSDEPAEDTQETATAV